MPLGTSRLMRLSVPMSVGIGHLALLLRQSGAEADVDVHVGAGVVVAVAVEYTSVGTVVIVATAVGQTLYPSPYDLLILGFADILPYMILPISAVIADHRL